ncbi:MAG: GNAT family N-acetyltransferase [Dehalococcoidia bacterium]|nr:MAG: GNAT family N-acetyltransferase [Dehalococcoidia bacterium]
MSTSATKVKIRKMTEADLQRVREVDHKLVGPYRSVSWPLRVDAHWWVYRGMPNFVAEVGNEIVGFILGDIRGGTQYGAEQAGAWIDMMGVAPEYQNMGIGRELVDAFCKACHSQGVKVRIFVVGDDKRLVKFFESCGFSQGNLVSYEK